jgi:small subunit ribosomal protein S3
MTNILAAGALGVELIISGKIPGARARSWRFYQGYLKKCGDVAVSGVRSAQASARLKSGIIGIKVAIMPPNIVLPDHVEILSEPVQIEEEIAVKAEEKKDKKQTKKKTAAKKTTKKKVTKKKVAKKKEEVTETKEKVDVKTEVKADVKAEIKEEAKEVKAEVKAETKEEAKEVKEAEKSD